jgi:hypothetical protein
MLENIDIVQVIATVVAFVSAASKLFGATKPFWGSLPTSVQRWLPGVVLMLGALPGLLAGAKTWTDFAVAVLGALALALPGRHTDIPNPKTAKPTVPPLGPALLALAALSLVGAQACSQGFSWPKVVESCAPAPADLVSEVTAILVRDGKLNDAALKDLEDLGRKHSGAAVLCVVSALVDEWTGKAGASPSEESGASKGREFLRRVGAKVSE